MRHRRVDTQTVLHRVMQEGVEARLAVREIRALIGSRLITPHRTERGARNLVSTTLSRDTRKEVIKKSTRGRYGAGDVLEWARAAFGRDPFADLPTEPKVVLMKVESGFKVRVTADLSVLPGTLKACHQLIKDQEREIKRLRAEVAERVPRRKRDRAGRFARRQD